MTESRRYFHGLNEIRNGRKRKSDKLDCKYYPGYHYNTHDDGLRLLKGCVLALAMSGLVMGSIWYVCRLVWG